MNLKMLVCLIILLILGITIFVMVSNREVKHAKTYSKIVKTPEELTKKELKEVKPKNLEFNIQKHKIEQKVLVPDSTVQSTPSKFPFTSTELKEMEGKINIEFGIREDILRYIEKVIPPDNVKAKNAAIKYAERSHFIYYKATPEEALKATEQQFITLECLRLFLKTDNYILVARNIAKLMRNTAARDKYMWFVDKNYFGWKVLGNGDLNTWEEHQLCQNENY